MPPISPDHLSPTGLRIAPAISAEARQDGAAYLAALRLGMTAEQADQLVAGMQAERRRTLGNHAETVAPKAELRSELRV